MTMRYDPEKCVGCAYCKLVCPTDAIDVHGAVELSRDKCVECGKCIEVCPTAALTH